jgi:NADH-quinone oxidoreductase subunit M
MTLNQIGLSGAVYQMFSHGIIAGLLFAVVGRMVYDRTHTRDLRELSRIPLARLLPFAAVTFVLAMMASIGLPGFSGFIAELQVLIGSWSAFPWMSCVAGVGILIGIAFSWRALQATFFGEGEKTATEALPPITMPERLGAFLLLGSTVVLGLYPRLLMDLIMPSLNGPLFEQLRRGVWR